MARARSRTGRLPGPARADLLAGIRRPRPGGARDQRTRPLRGGQGAGGDRAGSPRLGLGRVAVSRDRGDAGAGTGMSSAAGARRLLVRDLVQLATPQGTAAPLRGAALGDVQVLEDAYVLCHGSTVEAVGRMRDLTSLEGEVEEVDGRGLCAVPGLVDCHTHACFAGDRVEEFALRAGGATYEELHAAGGGIMATVDATRAAGAAALGEAVRTHRAWMLRVGTTTFESKSGYGLDRETEIASLQAIADAGGVPTWLGAHAVPPEFADADADLEFAL